MKKLKLNIQGNKKNFIFSIFAIAGFLVSSMTICSTQAHANHTVASLSTGSTFYKAFLNSKNSVVIQRSLKSASLELRRDLQTRNEADSVSLDSADSPRVHTIRQIRFEKRSPSL